MKRETGFVLILSVFLALLSPIVSCAQEKIEADIKTEEAEETSVEPEVQWLWGEVVSVNAQNKVFSVKYFDYETEAEKDITLNVDDKTAYESVQSIDEIKAKDTVSVDYIVTGGSSIAKNISVEKAEEEIGEEPGFPKEAIFEEAVEAELPESEPAEEPQE
jgi:hypothetical protein